MEDALVVRPGASVEPVDAIVELAAPAPLPIAGLPRHVGGFIEVREFHDRVRAGYLEMARAEPRRWVTVGAEGSPDEVARRVAEAADSRGLAGQHAVP